MPPLLFTSQDPSLASSVAVSPTFRLSPIRDHQQVASLPFSPQRTVPMLHSHEFPTQRRLMAGDSPAFTESQLEIVCRPRDDDVVHHLAVVVLVLSTLMLLWWLVLNVWTCLRGGDEYPPISCDEKRALRSTELPGTGSGLGLRLQVPDFEEHHPQGHNSGHMESHVNYALNPNCWANMV